MACDTTQNYRNLRVKAAFERMVQNMLERKEARLNCPHQWTDPQFNRGERRPRKVVLFMLARRREGTIKLPMANSTRPRKDGNSMTSNSRRPHRGSR